MVRIMTESNIQLLQYVLVMGFFLLLFRDDLLARVVAAGLPHHVTQRGNNRQDVFFVDQDRQTYLALLNRYSQHQAYALIPTA